MVLGGSVFGVASSRVVKDLRSTTTSSSSSGFAGLEAGPDGSVVLHQSLAFGSRHPIFFRADYVTVQATTLNGN